MNVKSHFIGCLGYNKIHRNDDKISIIVYIYIGISQFNNSYSNRVSVKI